MLLVIACLVIHHAPSSTHCTACASFFGAVLELLDEMRRLDLVQGGMGDVDSPMLRQHLRRALDAAGMPHFQG